MKNFKWVLLWLTLLPLYSFAQVNVRGDTTVCAGEYKIQLFADPLGGVWAGDSVTPDGRFNPDTLFLFAPAPNPVVLRYTVSGITVQKRITIRPTPRVTILTDDTSLCANSPAFTIRALPAGGTWSGAVGNTGVFTPTRALLGLQTITYTYVDPNNRLCPNDDQVRIRVNNYADVIAGANRTVCSKDDPFLLTGGSPSGGTYIDITPYLAGGVFTPRLAPVGVNSIVYIYTNPDQCVSSNTLVVTVNPTPNAYAGRDTSVCENSPSFNLQGFTPANGIFEGDGVSSNGEFDPSAQTVGFKLLTYKVSDQGCIDKDTVIVETIQAPRNVQAGRDTLICANSPAFNLTRGSPAGGRYFGAGIDSLTGRFSPFDTLVGSQKIFYRVRNPRGCSVKDSLQIDIRPLPRANAGIDFNACSGNAPVQIGDVRIPNAPGFRYTYLWSGSDGTFGFDSITRSNPIVRFTNTNPNPVVRKYFVRVTRNELGPPQITCFNQDSVTVTIYPKPTSRTIPPPTTKACPGDSIVLRAEQRTGYVFQWLNSSTVLTGQSDTNNTYIARSSGRYRLISLFDVQVRGGVCADTSSGDSIFFKPRINPVISGFANFCRGKTDTIRVFPRNSQFTYQWLKDSTQILIGQRDTTFNASSPGFYQVVLSDAREGLTCSFTSPSIRVDSIRTPYADLVERSSDSTFTVCSVQLPLQLIAPEDTNYRGAFQYQWQDSTTSRFFTIDTTGTYYLSVFNRCGRVTDTLRVNAINTTPIFSITPTADKTIRVCRGIPYLIQGPSGNFIFYRNQKILGRDSLGNLIVEDNGSSSNTNYPINTNDTGSFKISVLITSPQQCTYFDSATINVVDCESTVYIPTAFTPQNDGLNDLWEIQAYSVDDMRLTVVNRWGEMVYYGASLKDVQDRPWNGRYKDKDCLSGAYQYVVEFEGRQPGTEQIAKFKRTGTVTILR